MSSPFETLKKGLKVAGGILAFLIVGFVFYAIGASIYYWMNKDDNSIEPPEWWPEFWRNIIHNYPPTYKMVSNVIAMGTVSNTYSTNVKSPSDCSGLDKYGCNNADGCIGFMYETSASGNTCVQYSAISTPILDKRVTGNTLYIVEGNEPAKVYSTYVSNVADSTTTATLIPSYIASSYFDCASNCTSNSSCLGFEYKFADNTCIQHTAINASKLSFDTNYTSYILQGSSYTGANI